LKVLCWWKASGLHLKYSKAAVNNACVYGRIDVLRWWTQSGLQIKYSNIGMIYASSMSQVGVLQWWKDNALKFEMVTEAIGYAGSTGNLTVLKWWFESRITADWDELADEHACIRIYLNDNNCSGAFQKHLRNRGSSLHLDWSITS
jgi:hypothetical protein